MKYLIDCPECEGKGEVESAVTWCSKPISICCGGCTERCECEFCEGTGEIDLNKSLDDELSDLYSAIEDIVDKLQVTYSFKKTDIRSFLEKQINEIINEKLKK